MEPYPPLGLHIVWLRPPVIVPPISTLLDSRARERERETEWSIAQGILYNLMWRDIKNYILYLCIKGFVYPFTYVCLMMSYVACPEMPWEVRALMSWSAFALRWPAEGPFRSAPGLRHPIWGKIRGNRRFHHRQASGFEYFSFLSFFFNQWGRFFWRSRTQSCLSHQ